MSSPLTLTFAAGLVVGLAVAAWSASGVADDSRLRQPTAGTAGSSSRQAGRKLQWLPYRPSTPPAAGPAVTAERARRTAAEVPVRTAQRPQGTAFENPFADPGSSPKSPVPAAVPGDEVPDGNAPAIEMPGDSPPAKDLPTEPPTEPPAGPPAGLPAGPPAEPTAEQSRPDSPLQQSPGAPPETTFDQLLLPTPNHAAAQEQAEAAEACPSPHDPDYHTEISRLGTDISAQKGELPRECTLTEETIRPFALGELRRNAQSQPWATTTFAWKASALCHKPLYFEDVHLERYGHSWGPYLQPLASGANFFLTVPALPYKMGLEPPCECIYTLGYYRPGSCAPRMLDPFPLSIRAALAEGGAWTGMAFLIP